MLTIRLWDLALHLTAAQAYAIGSAVLILVALTLCIYMVDRVELSAHPHEAAVALIMQGLHAAETELVGREITTVRGTRGVVADVRLDNDHGLMFTLDRTDLGHRRFYPVSTIRLLHGEVVGEL